MSSTFYTKAVSKLNHSDAAEVQQTVQLNMDSDGKSSEVIGKNTGTIHYEIGFTLMAYKKSDNSIHEKLFQLVHRFGYQMWHQLDHWSNQQPK